MKREREVSQPKAWDTRRRGDGARKQRGLQVPGLGATGGGTDCGFPSGPGAGLRGSRKGQAEESPTGKQKTPDIPGMGERTSD